MRYGQFHSARGSQSFYQILLKSWDASCKISRVPQVPTRTTQHVSFLHAVTLLQSEKVQAGTNCFSLWKIVAPSSPKRLQAAMGEKGEDGKLSFHLLILLCVTSSPTVRLPPPQLALFSSRAWKVSLVYCLTNALQWGIAILERLPSFCPQ